MLQSETAVARPAPPEVTGDGALFPALVVGVGAVGLTVLQRLRENLHRRFGSLANVPHLRLLLLDTDPEVVRTATTAGRGRPCPAATYCWPRSTGPATTSSRATAGPATATGSTPRCSTASRVRK